jgi:hypothetical protein
MVASSARTTKGRAELDGVLRENLRRGATLDAHGQTLGSITNVRAHREVVGLAPFPQVLGLP